MSECTHKNLVMIREASDKLRCHHCHLTISADELNEGFCPECYEETGKKRYDFKPVAAKNEDVTHYRCEDCGAVIQSGNG